MKKIRTIAALLMTAIQIPFAEETLAETSEPTYVHVPGKIAIADIELSAGLKAENSNTNIGYFLEKDRFFKINLDLPADGDYILTFDTSCKDTECIASVKTTNGALTVNGVVGGNLTAPVTNEWGAYTIHHKIHLKGCTQGHATITLTNISGGCNFKNFYCHTSDENGLYYAPATGDISIYDIVIADKVRNENDGEYLDYFNVEGKFIELYLSIPEAGNYSLTFMASNKSKVGTATVSATSGTVYVNGEADKNILDLPVTGSWDVFQNRLIVLYGCEAGNMTVRITNTSGESNFKNFHCECYKLDVTYDANNGNGTMMNQTIEAIGNLEGYNFTRNGYTFMEWNTQADGNGKSYTDEQKIMVTAENKGNITLYAQWKLDETPTGVDIINTNKTRKSIKTIENGEIIIIRDDGKYSISGRKL